MNCVNSSHVKTSPPTLTPTSLSSPPGAPNVAVDFRTESLRKQCISDLTVADLIGPNNKSNPQYLLGKTISVLRFDRDLLIRRLCTSNTIQNDRYFNYLSTNFVSEEPWPDAMLAHLHLPQLNE